MCPYDEYEYSRQLGMGAAPPMVGPSYHPQAQQQQQQQQQVCLLLAPAALLCSPDLSSVLSCAPNRSLSRRVSRSR